MKKILGILSLAVVMMMAAVPADAQVKFGLTGGVNLSKMSLNEMPELSSNNRAGCQDTSGRSRRRCCRALLAAPHERGK